MHIVYGGAFNPLTKAHIDIVNLILKTYKNSKVIIVPVGNDYNKSELIDFHDRYNMINLVFKNNKNVIVSKIEHENVFQGTIETLNKLSETYSNIHLLVGSDNILYFDKWIKYEKLLSTYPLLIVNRDNVLINNVMSKYNYLNVKFNIIKYNSEINSSLIRKNINKYKEWLNIDVFNYIKENKLYGAD